MKFDKTYLTVPTLLFILNSLSYAQTLTSVEYEELKMKAGKEYKAKKFLDSYKSLMKLYRENPEDRTLYLPIARAAFNAGKNNQAVMAYERVLETRENDPQIYVELAVVYSRIKDFIQAKEYLEIAREKSNDSQKASIDKLMDQLDSVSSTTKIGGGITLGLGWDSNANFGADSREVVLGGLPIQLSDASTPKSSYAVNSSFWLNLTDNFDPRNTKYLLIADLNVYSKLFTDNDVKDNSFLWTKLAVGLRTYFQKAYFDIQATTDFTKYNASNSDIHTYGIQGDLNAKLTNTIFSTTSFSIDEATYSNNELNDGITISLSQQLRFSVLQRDSLSLYLGYSNRDAEAKRHAYDEIKGSVRYAFNVVDQLYYVPSIGFSMTDYKAPATVLERDNREDREVWGGLTALWYFADGFSSDLSYRYTKNDSSSDVYKYTQKTLTLSFSYYF